MAASSDNLYVYPLETYTLRLLESDPMAQSIIAAAQGIDNMPPLFLKSSGAYKPKEFYIELFRISYQYRPGQEIPLEKIGSEVTRKIIGILNAHPVDSRSFVLEPQLRISMGEWGPSAAHYGDVSQARLSVSPALDSSFRQTQTLIQKELADAGFTAENGYCFKWSLSIPFVQQLNAIVGTVSFTDAQLVAFKQMMEKLSKSQASASILYEFERLTQDKKGVPEPVTIGSDPSSDPICRPSLPGVKF